MGPKKRAASRPKDLGDDWVTNDADWDWGEKPSKKAASAKSAAAPAAKGAAGGAAERINLNKLNTKALQKYRALFKLPGEDPSGGEASKNDLMTAVSAHFFRQQVDEDETLLRFVVALRRQSPKGLHIGPAARARGGAHAKHEPHRAPAE